MGIRIAGTGSHLPGPPIDNDRLRTFLRRHPDGLSIDAQERLIDDLGIATRHFGVDVDDDSRRESNTSMAAAAGRQALADAGWRPEEVDLLLVTTVVPDHLMPSTSALVQEALGIPRCMEVELVGNCSAPFKALAFAAAQLKAGEARRALVCSSQYVSFLGLPPWMNPARMQADQGHLRWTLSDGAAAIALEASESDIDLRVWLESAGSSKRSGMSLALGAAMPDLLGMFETGGQHVTQDARRALRAALPLAIDSLNRMLERFRVDPRSIDHFIPAVSSVRLGARLRRTIADRCGVPIEAWHENVRRVGYLGGVGFFLALDELARAGTLKRGAVICAVAEESSKWTSAAAVFRWNPAG